MTATPGWKERSTPARRPLEDEEVIVFVHVPKTAGITLTNLLTANYPRRSIRRVRTAEESLELLEMTRAERNRIDILAGHVPFGVHELLDRPVRYFTLLRDPVERLVSAYHYVIGRPDHPLYDHYAGYDTFSDYVVGELARGFRTAADSPVVGQLVGAIPHQLLPDRRGRDPMGQALANLEAIDHVGTTERIGDFAAVLRFQLLWRPRPLGHANATPDRPPAGDEWPDVRSALDEVIAAERQLHTAADIRLSVACKELGTRFRIERALVSMSDRRAGRVANHGLRAAARARRRLRSASAGTEHGEGSA